jgi:hypothetical protein
MEHGGKVLVPKRAIFQVSDSTLHDGLLDVFE